MRRGERALGLYPALPPRRWSETTPFLAKLVDHAVRYYRDRVAPTKSYRADRRRSCRLYRAA